MRWVLFVLEPFVRVPVSVPVVVVSVPKPEFVPVSVPVVPLFAPLWSMVPAPVLSGEPLVVSVLALPHPYVKLKIVSANAAKIITRLILDFFS